MTTDDERREVAQKLRELEQGVVGALIQTGELAENILRAIDYGRSGAMTPYGCLADLIEPMDSESAEGAGSGVPKCDRDALLELADGIDVDANNNRGGTFLRYYSKCIREALGVDDA